jgi:hypothetical protein
MGVDPIRNGWSITIEQMEADLDLRFDAIVSDWAIRVFVKTAGSEWKHVITQFPGG